MASSNPSQPSTTPIILARTVRRITRRLPILSISFPGFIYFPPALSRRVKTALGRLEYSFSISLTIRRLVRFYGLDRRKGSREWEEFKFPWAETIEHGLLVLMAIPLFYVQTTPILIKLFFIFGYMLLCLVPVTSQFFFPAAPVLAWVLLFFSNRFIPKDLRPHIWVSVLPTLETVLYGTNISDILTRYKSQIAFLDILAWLPYGVLHFALPGIVAILLFIFVEKEGAIKLFARAFGYMNLAGVFIQIVFPCAPPWYELIHGLTPADYGMIGSPAGLARIDTLFGSHSYTTTFRASPLVFGAFPSLHAGCSTMLGLFMTHFFPWGKVYWWSYVATVYWSTMHLSHHYMIDLTAGGSLTIIFFYYFLSRSSFIDYTPPSQSPTQQNVSRFVTGVRNINGDPTPEASSGSDSPTDESLSETGMERDLEGAYGTKFERMISHFGLSGRKDDKNGRFFDDGVPNSAVPFLADQERPLTPMTPNRAKIVIEESDPSSHLDKP